ncbi:uncharacterized protein [Amphiura filiformis]|uniref:uncharacterized protein n=1 Tax=Amphiura filiformis TaxID=82378 RepID=UPI003B2240F4
MLSTLPKGTFQYLTNLEYLYLLENQISQLHEGVFQGLSELKHLYLHSNMLSTLPKTIFEHLTKLECLYLQQNQISQLNEEVFQGLSELKCLYLGSNMLSTLQDDIFQNLTNLEILDLHQNNIVHLDLISFVELDRLGHLYLFNSMLETIHIPEGVYQILGNLREFSFYFTLSSGVNEALVLNMLNSLSRLTVFEIGTKNETLLPKVLTNKPQLMHLQLSHMNIVTLVSGIFIHLGNLTSLDISKIGLVELNKGVFNGLFNLVNLYAGQNKLKHLDKDVFQGIQKLVVLELQNNYLTHLDQDIFKDMGSLETLNVSNNVLVQFTNGVFDGLIKLNILDARQNQLKSLGNDVFEDLVEVEFLYLQNNQLTQLDLDMLKGTQYLYVDLSNNKMKEILSNKIQNRRVELHIFNNPLTLITRDSFSSLNTRGSQVLANQHEVCECYVPSQVACSASDLLRSPYLTCDRLLSEKALVVVMWLIGLNAFGGNIFVLAWRNKGTTPNKVNSVLLSNLAISDCLMGIYMLIIASADLYFGEYFPMISEKWRSGITCRIAGALSIISSEASVFLVTLISIDRFICIRFPFSTIKITKKSVITLTILTWIFSFVLGIVPSALAGRNFKFYDNSHVCIGLPLALTKTYTTDYVPLWNGFIWVLAYRNELETVNDGLYFSSAVFLGLNCLCYLVILGCYIEIVRAVRKSSKHAGRSSAMKKQIRLTVKVSAIVATDFCCWFPIIVLGILVQTRVIILPPSVYAWCVTFVLPINSAINPYLYTIAEVISKCRAQKGENHSTLQISLTQTQASQNTPNVGQPKVATKTISGSVALGNQEVVTSSV